MYGCFVGLHIGKGGSLRCWHRPRREGSGAGIGTIVEGSEAGNGTVLLVIGAREEGLGVGFGVAKL